MIGLESVKRSQSYLINWVNRYGDSKAVVESAVAKLECYVRRRVLIVWFIKRKKKRVENSWNTPVCLSFEAKFPEFFNP